MEKEGVFPPIATAPPSGEKSSDHLVAWEARELLSVAVVTVQLVCVTPDHGGQGLDGGRELKLRASATPGPVNSRWLAPNRPSLTALLFSLCNGLRPNLRCGLDSRAEKTYPCLGRGMGVEPCNPEPLWTVHNCPPQLPVAALLSWIIDHHLHPVKHLHLTLGQWQCLQEQPETGFRLFTPVISNNDIQVEFQRCNGTKTWKMVAYFQMLRLNFWASLHG
ncbi:hypothetical protein AAFF_G00078800 [Aldrovandia affinis]|uniref:Uncharacterized protein n=1 Tax=Aldrovandia affinis TaxID=143900 RepID=A0AAD7RXG8_9TELE|nr:hypothetical protein AAFF_G00078800 [Aldrovandia affinis]